MKSAHVLDLPGLVGGNPLGFLAALGTLRALTLTLPTSSPKLAWNTALRPSIHTTTPLDKKTLISHLQTVTDAIIESGAVSFDDIIGTESQKYDDFVNASFNAQDDKINLIRLLFAAAFGTSAVTDAKKGTIIPNDLSFSNRQGGKLLLKDFRTLVSHLTFDQLHSALFESWAYKDENEPTFRWDPQDLRTGAHMADDPISAPRRSVAGANVLAFIGISFLVSVPTSWGLITTGIHRTGNQQALIWPLWSAPLDVDVVLSLLQQKQWHASTGVFASFSAQRYKSPKNNLYLMNAIAMDGSSHKE